MITQEELKEFLFYNPKSGVFLWRVKPSRNIWIGKQAGRLNTTTGYREIQINGTRYQSHRLAWLYVNGKFPDDQIDHINHDRVDNRVVNLREASNSSNRKNMSIRSDNTSGVNGVNWDKAKNKWQVRIKLENKRKHLGYFENIEDAIVARKQANLKYNFHTNHGVTV